MVSQRAVDNLLSYIAETGQRFDESGRSSLADDLRQRGDLSPDELAAKLRSDARAEWDALAARGSHNSTQQSSAKRIFDEVVDQSFTADRLHLEVATRPTFRRGHTGAITGGRGERHDFSDLFTPIHEASGKLPKTYEQSDATLQAAIDALRQGNADPASHLLGPRDDAGRLGDVKLLQTELDHAFTRGIDDPRALTTFADIATKLASRGLGVPTRLRRLRPDFDAEVRRRWTYWDTTDAEGRLLPRSSWQPSQTPGRSLTDADLSALKTLSQHDFRHMLQGGGRRPDIPKPDYLDETQWRTYQTQL